MVWLILTHDPSWPVMLLFSFLGFVALWLSTGSVIKDRYGVGIKYPGYSRFVRWPQITTIEVKRSRAIIVRAGQRQFVIGPQFVATAELLLDIQAETA